MRELLYDSLKLDVRHGVTVGSTAGGLKSTCESVLKKLAPYHKIPGHFIHSATKVFLLVDQKVCKNNDMHLLCVVKKV